MFRREQIINFKYLVVIVGVLLMFIGGSIIYLKPHWMKKKLILSQLISLEKQLAAKQKVLETCSLSRKQLDSLQKRFLSSGEDPFQNSQLIAAIVSGQLLPQDLISHSLTRQRIQRKQGFSEIPVVVSMTGIYMAVIEFLYQIANLRYPVALQHFKWRFADYLAGDQRSLNKREISLLFHIYQMNQPLINTQSHFWDSFALRPYRLAPYSLNNMKMTGFLESTLTGKRWGLIKLLNTDRQIYKVEEGDMIGMERASVSEIDSEKIIIQEKDSNKKRELSLENRNKEYDVAN